jgi:hypothetical protein
MPLGRKRAGVLGEEGRLTNRWSRPEIQPDLSREGELSELRAGGSAPVR